MATPSETLIACLALGHLGKSPIDDLDENSQEAVEAKKKWALVRDYVQADFPWGMCRELRALTLTTNDRPYDWAYKYLRPTCLRFQRVHPQKGYAPSSAPIAYERMNGALYTNEPYARATLIISVEDVTLWTPGFINAFAWRLAHELVMPLTKSKTDLKTTFDGYENAKDNARVTEASEDQRPAQAAETTAPWLAERGHDGAAGYRVRAITS